MRIPEGSMEEDFNGRRLCAGRLGRRELYVSWVWRGWRYLYAVGARYDRFRPGVSVWARKNEWFV